MMPKCMCVREGGTDRQLDTTNCSLSESLQNGLNIDFSPEVSLSELGVGEEVGGASPDTQITADLN